MLRYVRKYIASVAPICVAIAALTIPITVRAASPGPGEAAVRAVLDAMRKLADANDPSQRGAALETINHSLAISSLARASLGEQWRKLGKEKRERFVALLTKTLQRSAYPRAARALSTLSVEFGEEEDRGAERLVHTKIANADGGQIAVDYRLTGRGDDLKIADVYLDGQSLVNLVGERVQDALRQGGYDKLVADMEKHVAADGARGKR